MIALHQILKKTILFGLLQHNRGITLPIIIIGRHVSVPISCFRSSHALVKGHTRVEPLVHLLQTRDVRLFLKNDVFLSKLFQSKDHLIVRSLLLIHHLVVLEVLEPSIQLLLLLQELH